MDKPKPETGRKLKYEQLANLDKANTVIEIPFKKPKDAVSIAVSARQYAQRNGFTVETVKQSEKQTVWIKRVS